MAKFTYKETAPQYDLIEFVTLFKCSQTYLESSYRTYLIYA